MVAAIKDALAQRRGSEPGGRSRAAALRRRPGLQRGGEPPRAARAPGRRPGRARPQLRGHPGQRRQPRPLAGDPAGGRGSATRASWSSTSTATTASTPRSSPASRRRAARSSSPSTPTCRTRPRRSASWWPRWTRGSTSSARCASSARTRLFRRLASRLVNKVTALTTGVQLSDYGCMLRAYRREVVQDAVPAPRRSRPSSRCWPTCSPGGSPRCRSPTPSALRGESKYSLWKLVKLQFDLMTSFSILAAALDAWRSGLAMSTASMIVAAGADRGPPDLGPASGP